MVSYYMVLFKYIVFIGLILVNMQAFLMYLILNIFSILLLILLDQYICKSILLYFGLRKGIKDVLKLAPVFLSYLYENLNFVCICNQFPC